MEALFDRITQIAIVVPDTDAFVRVMHDKYNIGPWPFHDFGGSGISIENVYLDGEFTDTYIIRNSGFAFPSVELEVIQPVSGPSVFAKYAREHGPGVQHLCVNNRDYYKTWEAFRRCGYGEGQTAKVGGFELCGFSDHMPLLGTYLEIHKRDRLPDPASFPTYPADGGRPAGEPLFTDIRGCGIVVEDAEKAARIFAEEYGAGDWREAEPLTEAGGHVVRRLTADFGAALELLQPVPGEGHFGRWLRENGPGAHHITVVSDMPEARALAMMAPELGMGSFKASAGGEEHCYYDQTGSTGVYWEFVRA